VTTAENGHEAIELVRKSMAAAPTPAFDLVILDMIMEPDLDGVETMRAIRDMAPDIPVIVTSGYAPTGRGEEAVAQGAVWLQKPYKIDQIARAVSDLLARRDSTAPPSSDPTT
jgi:CheY-like chemotaxis protein